MIAWILHATESLESFIAIPIHDIRIAMAEIYRGIAFHPESPLPT